MKYLRRILSKFRSHFQNARVEEELVKEISTHLALLEDEFQSKGMSPEDAHLAARRAYGGVEQAKQLHRDERSFQGLAQTIQDVRFAVRQLCKAPGFAATAVLTLALGIGANASIFSLINGLLLRPLPVPHAEQLAVLRIDQIGRDPLYGLSAPFFRSLESRHKAFSDIFAYFEQTMQVRGRSGNENVPGVLVSGEFFRGLQAAPLLGRYLTPEDDRTGGNPSGFAIVISEHFWQSWFNRAPTAIGRKLQIANTIFTVVGVMPKRFIGADPIGKAEIYLPLSAEPIVDAPTSMVDAGYHARWLTVMARLSSGVTLKQANAELLTISSPILHEASDARMVTEGEKEHFHFVAEPGSKGFTYIRTLFRKPLVAVFSMCGGILLLACLNLAALLFARAAARERELATRLALGATRWRVVRQLMVESFLIATLGAAAGLAISPMVSQLLSVQLMSGVPNVYIDPSLDWRVFGFAVLIAIVAAVVIGFVPALRATAGNLNDYIKDGQHAMHGPRQRRFVPSLLLASEVGLAMILIVGAGLLATSLKRLQESGVGFDPNNLVNIAFSMDKQPLTGDALAQLYRQIAERLENQPTVKSVSFELITPFSGGGVWDGDYSRPGVSTHKLYMNSVGPNYFSTMRIPMFEGEDFSWNDATKPKIILNKSAAKLLFPGQSPVGQYVVSPHDKTSLEVVAVVGDAKYDDLRASAPPTGYVPLMNAPGNEKPSYTAIARIQGPVMPLAGAARALAAQLAPTIPAPELTTMEGVLEGSVSAERMMTQLALFFAGCALLITAIGLYGTLAYATTRRTKEIGIRMALGAQRSCILRLVLASGGKQAVTGCVIGLIGAVVVSRLLRSFLFEVSPFDPLILMLSMAIIVLLALAASAIPARRAASIDPMQALRGE